MNRVVFVQCQGGSARAQFVSFAPSKSPAMDAQVQPHGLQPQQPDTPGRRFRYKRIGEEDPHGYVGKGTYGQVFIAEDTLTGDVVAVKRQEYPSTEAEKELAFAKTLASNPSIPLRKGGEEEGGEQFLVSMGGPGGWGDREGDGKWYGALV